MWDKTAARNHLRPPAPSLDAGSTTSLAQVWGAVITNVDWPEQFAAPYLHKDAVLLLTPVWKKAPSLSIRAKQAIEQSRQIGQRGPKNNVWLGAMSGSNMSLSESDRLKWYLTFVFGRSK